MRLLSGLLLLFLISHSQAASLTACSASWRVGQHIVHRGDSISRTLATIDKAGSQLRWINGPRGARWTLISGGRNPRTIHIQLRDGRIDQLCQYRG